MSFGKAVVKNADMEPVMQEDAVQIAAVAREKYEVDKDIATYIKQHFDRKYGRTWHCIVGKQYGSKVIVKDTDMNDEMMELAIRVTACAMDRFQADMDVANYIKTQFNKKYGRSWHCIVGRRFGSDVSHEERSFIYFFLGDRAILLYKSG
ncbi:Dynein light chain 1, cytoplasmic [Schistosoma haematobium]|uniref:Dynein light chain n=1 Tax=Schistosoma haematobium TaxID=6185 RepID=A0A6A5D1W5_SCHHA|nr:Dynein light chain 1, cytoplasmic [Schistosoma haematobium]KAH9588131.1 Dynein light chain 1, cytoplasmic [Schistosoma haematobium]